MIDLRVFMGNQTIFEDIKITKDQEDLINK